MQEIEVKILEVYAISIRKKMLDLGAELLQDTRLFVDWYSPKGIIDNKHPWYLRVRKDKNGKSEMSWKSLPVFIENTRQSKEINFFVGDFDKAKQFLEALLLVHYAHQEKDRVSWKYKDWNFDLDAYPGMPAYLEIEGKSSEHIKQAIELLGLQSHKSISEGETPLIKDLYNLNWNDMRF